MGMIQAIFNDAETMAGDKSFGDDDGLPPLEEVESVVKHVPLIESDAILRSRMLHSLGLMLTKKSKLALDSLPSFCSKRCASFVHALLRTKHQHWLILQISGHSILRLIVVFQNPISRNEIAVA